MPNPADAPAPPSGAISRRALIGGAAAAGAAAALPAARATAAPARRSADVIVVGAGLAGLSAARAIAAAGRSVIVVEARERVGGRTLNASLARLGGPGEVVEVGGQWVGPTQNRITALAKSVGVKTFKTYNEGDNILRFAGEVKRYKATDPLPPLSGATQQAFLKAFVEIDALAQTVPLDAPWKAPRAREFDSQTFASWAQANIADQGARDFFTIGIEAVWAAEPADVSLLHVLFYIRSAGDAKNAGSLARLISTAGGAQESRFVGGSQRISIEVARRLGRRVVLNAPVRRIAQGGGRVRVTTDAGVFTGKRVIVTVPPALCGRIDYDPLLPGFRDQLTQRFPMGSVIKCEAVYDRPFWRDAGYSGQVISDTGPVKITFDNSPPSGKPGVLLGFLEGDAARQLGRRSAKARRDAALQAFARSYGDRALKPRAFVTKSWAEDEWTRGCYVGYTGPGVLTSFGEAIRAPIGRIHWAGTETATEWNGYMDGAVQSGQRAAKEVLAQI